MMAIDSPEMLINLRLFTIKIGAENIIFSLLVHYQSEGTQLQNLFVNVRSETKINYFNSNLPQINWTKTQSKIQLHQSFLVMMYLCGLLKLNDNFGNNSNLKNISIINCKFINCKYINWKLSELLLKMSQKIY